MTTKTIHNAAKTLNMSVLLVNKISHKLKV